MLLNSLPNNKILDWSKLKAYADDKLNAIEKLKFVFGLGRKQGGKGENAGLHACEHLLCYLLTAIVISTLSQTSPGFYVSAI